MAALMASRRAVPVSKLVEKLLFSSTARATTVAPASAAARRSFNTSAEMRDYEDERSLDRRSNDAPAPGLLRGDDFPTFFSGALDPFFGPSRSRSLSQVLNIMDQMLDSPFTASRGMAPRRGWDAREDKDALYLRIDMPGLGKEHVRVSAEQNTLIIKGEEEKESDDEEIGRRYSTRIDLPPELYKMDHIRAEMKNGVLKVVVPKVKEDERKDVFQVTVK